MGCYRVASPLTHDGAAYQPGDVVDGTLFTAAQRSHLEACGTLMPAADEPGETEPAETGDGAAEGPNGPNSGADDPADPEAAPTSPRSRKGRA